MGAEDNESVMRITSDLRAARFLKVAEIMGLDTHNLKWAFTTGRLDIDTEWAIMQYLGAGQLESAYYSLGIANQWLSMWGDATVGELESKGWLPKSSQAKARQILNRKSVRRWCYKGAKRVLGYKK